MNRDQALAKILEYIENEEDAYHGNLVDKFNVNSHKYNITRYKGLIECDELRDYVKEHLK